MPSDTPHPWENPNRPKPTTPRNLFVAYLLWLPLGFFVGAHRVYLGDHKNAGIWLALIVVSYLLTKALPDFPLGTFVGGALWIWWGVDAFQLPGMVRRFNESLKGSSTKVPLSSP